VNEVRLRDSVFSRLALWAVLLPVAVTLLLWAATVATLDSTSKAALARAVDVDLAGLADINASGGQKELELRIADRLALAADDGNNRHYLVADNTGNRLAGDIAQWPNLSARISQSGYVRLPENIPAFGRATQLGPDLKLLVAHEYGHDSALARQLGWTYLAAGTFAAIAIGLLAFWRARQLARRVHRINHAFREPDESALAALAEGKGEQDELGEITRHSAEVLGHLRRMVTSHKETADQIAHELRTPLMHLDNRLVKALHADPDEECARLLADARGEIRQIVALLESLLDIATSEARRGDRLGLSPVDLSQLAARIGELYADSAEDSGHQFKRAIMPDVIVQGEEMQLTRLITNLLDNAFKYVPSGGTVRLSLEHGPKLTVSDDGPGIAAVDQDRIFDRFRRGTGNGSSGQGAGLGLALARAIAERHGLSLSLASSEKGASFVLSREAI
jgi:signal transduction histidine kinase